MLGSQLQSMASVSVHSVTEDLLPLGSSQEEGLVQHNFHWVCGERQSLISRVYSARLAFRLYPVGSWGASTEPSVALRDTELENSGVPRPRLLLLPHNLFVSVKILNGFFAGVVLGFD